MGSEPRPHVKQHGTSYIDHMERNKLPLHTQDTHSAFFCLSQLIEHPQISTFITNGALRYHGKFI